MSGDREKCIAAGMSDYLAKPIETRKLALMLEKWLGRTDAGDAPANAITEKVAQVLNREALLSRVMGDQELADTVFVAFLNDTAQKLRFLKNRLVEGDAEGARSLAHTLKGAAATVSAEALQSLCAGAEIAAASGNLRGALALLPQMEEQFELLKATVSMSVSANAES
jgi:HPt (histidine-containing phosphotransfer) domain-containing protein